MNSISIHRLYRSTQTNQQESYLQLTKNKNLFHFVSYLFQYQTKQQQQQRKFQQSTTTTKSFKLRFTSNYDSIVVAEPRRAKKNGELFKFRIIISIETHSYRFNLIYLKLHSF